MGWIKAELDDTTHETLRREVEKYDAPTHKVAATLLKQRLRTTDSWDEVADDA